MNSEIVLNSICMVICGLMVGKFLWNWEKINDLIERGRIAGYGDFLFSFAFLVMFMANLLTLLPDSAFRIPLIVQCGAMLFGLLFTNYYLICDRSIDFVRQIVWVIVELSLVAELMLGIVFGVLDSFTLSIILIIDFAVITFYPGLSLRRKKTDDEAS